MNETSPITNVLAERYASPAIKAIWSPTGRVALERDFWIAVMKAQRDLGVPIPAEAIKDYEKVKAKIDLASIDARERVTLHVSVLGDQAGQDTAFQFTRVGETETFYWVDRRMGYALSGNLARERLAVLADAAYRQLPR